VTSPLRDPKWARRLTDLLEWGVDTVRTLATRPMAIAIRAVTFAVVVAAGVVTAVVLVLVATTRGVHEVLDLWLAREDAVWVGYLALAAVFVLIGAALLRRRHGGDD
jgi:hypothetical protein